MQTKYFLLHIFSCFCMLLCSKLALAQVNASSEMPQIRQAVILSHKTAVMEEKQSSEVLRQIWSKHLSQGILGGKNKVLEISSVWRDRLIRIGERYNLDPALLAAIVCAESKFNARARSKRGALGAMQIMPKTGRYLGLKGLKNFFNPEENLDAGARYLLELIQQFPKLYLAIAAYNAGPNKVKQRYSQKQDLPKETQTYTAKVLVLYGMYRQIFPNSQLEAIMEK